MIKKILKKKCIENKTFNKFYNLSKKNEIIFFNKSTILSFDEVKKLINEKRHKLIETFKSEVNKFNNNDLLEKVKPRILELEKNIKSLNKNLSLLQILEENNMFKENNIIEKINYNIFTNKSNKSEYPNKKFSNKNKYLAEYSNS